jgi:RHS repeat-associated protein
MARLARVIISGVPHAVTGISGGTISTTFTGRSIGYTPYNKPASITQGSTTLFFSHDVDHQRFKKNGPDGVTLYFDVFGVHAELVQSATSTWSEFLVAGDGLVGVRYERSDEVITTRYFTRDHLGSVAVLTDENGLVVERLSYDAWGKRRFPNGMDDAADSLSSQTTRGFTGQENLDAVGLVHLNGRVYDPVIGRMMSADPFVPDPTNAQTWNRYSYVINNPLSITDPNGYCFLGLCSFAGKVGHALRSLLPAIKSIAVLAASAIVCQGNPACAILVATAVNTIVAGVSTGNLGQALRAGAVTLISSIGMYAVGDITGHAPGFADTAKYAGNVAGHALVGCVSAVGSGSTCQSGALAGAVTAAAGPIINHSGFVAGLAANSVLGGLAAVAGGGKFANGAVTAAFGYLFNFSAWAHNAMTRQAALRAGFSSQVADKLAEGVVDVDHEPHSQDPEYSYKHNMRAPNQTMEQFFEQTKAYVQEQWNLKSMQGLQHLLHWDQDGYAGGHAGGQIWYGKNEPTGTFVWHMLQDVGTFKFDSVVDHSAKLIIQYNNNCGGCIR